MNNQNKGEGYIYVPVYNSKKWKLPYQKTSYDSDDHKIVDALFCDRVFAPESFQKSVDEPSMGYRYKVRVEASQGVVRTQNLLSIEGRWYIAV